MGSTWQNIKDVITRELRIIRQRPIYFLATVVVVAFNAVFFLTFLKDGLPHDLPVGIVDMDHSSTSRSFCQQLDATPLSKVIQYESIEEAREDMEKGKITSYVLLPEHFNEDILANRRPTVSFYVNTLYFVGGALSYKDIYQMVQLTNGAVQRQVLRAKGFSDSEIMDRIRPVNLDQHQIGNTTTNYGVYLINILLPGVLALCIVLIVIYGLGSELKYGTSKHLMKTAGGSINIAVFGKLVPYTLTFFALGICLELLLFHWMHYPLAGSIWNMMIDMILMILGYEAIAIFIIEMIPSLRLAISIGALFSVLGFSLAGFTLPIEAMPPYIQGLASIFPLRHYYLFFVQEAIFGSGFAGWWQHAVHMLLFLFLPAIGLYRLKGAYINQNFPRD